MASQLNNKYTRRWLNVRRMVKISKILDKKIKPKEGSPAKENEASI